MAKNRILFSNDFVLKNEKVGINTTDPQALLDVNGGLRVAGVSTFLNDVEVGTGITFYASTGIVSATAFYGSGLNLTDLILGIQIQEEGSDVGVGFTYTTLNFIGDYVTATGVGTVANITFTTPPYSNVAGIATYATSAGIVTYASNAGVATYASNAGVATYASNAGVSTYATSAGIATYATSAGIVTYASNAGIATYATSAGIATYASNAGIATYASNAGVATYASNAGIATYASNAGIATYASNAGIATYATSAGIVTYASNAGVATYASNAGIATYASNAGIATYASNAGIATYAGTAGISTVSEGLTGTPNINVGIVTATEYYGTFKGTIDSNVTLENANYSNVAGVATYATSAGVSTSVIGGIGSITQLSVSGLSTFTGIGTFGNDLYVGGNVSVVGVLTAQRLYSTIYGEFVGGAISGDSLVGTALSISGISTLGTVQISSGIITATSGVVTYYGDGQYLSGVVSLESNGEFYTGVSSSLQLTPLSYETSIYTFPSTAGKQYVIESINVANVDTSVGVGTTVNIIASIEDSSGEQTYIAYNVPIVNGGLIELLKNAIVAGPSDVIKMWVTDGNYSGVNNAAEVYMNYSEYTSTEYISEYASTVSIATTDITTVYTSSTYPSVIEAIHLANRTDIGDYPVSVTITNGVTTTYLAKDLLIPRYSTVDILDRPKRIELNGTLGIKVGQTSTIDVIIAGKQITS